MEVVFLKKRLVFIPYLVRVVKLKGVLFLINSMEEVKKDSVENSLVKSINVKEDLYKKSILIVSFTMISSSSKKNHTSVHQMK